MKRIGIFLIVLFSFLNFSFARGKQTKNKNSEFVNESVSLEVQKNEDTGVYYNKKILNATEIENEISQFLTRKQTINNEKELKNLDISTLFANTGYDYYQFIDFDNGILFLCLSTDEEYVSGSSVSYDIKNNSFDSPFCYYFWKNNGEDWQKPVSIKYFNVNGKAASIEKGYIKAERVKVDDSNSVFKEKIVITGYITFQEKTFGIIKDFYIVPFNCFVIDELKFSNSSIWKEATTADDVIELLGLPDKIEKYSFRWPDRKSKNGFTYSPEVTNSAYGEHWRYKSYPDLVIDMVGNKVRSFTTNRDKSFFEEAKKQK